MTASFAADKRSYSFNLQWYGKKINKKNTNHPVENWTKDPEVCLQGEKKCKSLIPREKKNAESYS